jgi:hypothetical protein
MENRRREFSGEADKSAMSESRPSEVNLQPDGHCRSSSSSYSSSKMGEGEGEDEGRSNRWTRFVTMEETRFKMCLEIGFREGLSRGREF